MIDKQEVLSISKKLNISIDVIEKDYVLGWLLAGLTNHKLLQGKWIFKGGTCLKKCYFGEYRFSEDLDFTLLERKHIDQISLTKMLKTVSEWIYENSGIEIASKSIRFDIYSNLSGGKSAQGFLNFQGPMKRKTNLQKIKLDLTADEYVVLKPKKQALIHNYSDSINHTVCCYPLDEMYAEKLRALFERARARDLYDVVHIFQKKEHLLHKEQVINSLQKKCQYKKIQVPSLMSIEKHPRKKNLFAEWELMLQHQLPNLQPIQKYWRQLPQIFEWLNIDKFGNKRFPK